MFCCWQVSWLKSLESYSSAVGRMSEQEEAGFWCSSVEGFKAEGEAIICGFKMVVLLSTVFFWVLPPYAGGGCFAGSFARLLLPFRLGIFASGCSTLST